MREIRRVEGKVGIWVGGGGSTYPAEVALDSLGRELDKVDGESAEVLRLKYVGGAVVDVDDANHAALLRAEDTGLVPENVARTSQMTCR